MRRYQRCISGGENADYFELLRTFVAIAPYKLLRIFVAIAPYKLLRLGNANKFALLLASAYICGFTN